MRCNSLYTRGISCSSACLLPFFNSASRAVISGEERCEGLGSTDMLASEFPGEFGDSKHIAGWRPKKLESAGIWRVPKKEDAFKKRGARMLRVPGRGDNFQSG